MRKNGGRGLIASGLFALFSFFQSAAPVLAADMPMPASSGDPKRGEIMFRAGNCTSCHTDLKAKGPLLAGGRALHTPFGTFYGPNITPDPQHGIGKWTDRDFIRAMREGRSPDGSHYYPVFPFTSFTLMADQDLLDLKAYLMTLPPVARPNKPHDVRFPFNFRFPLAIWKAMFFAPGRFRPDPAKDEEWNRGAYLVNGPGHCGECHTQRNLLGGLKRDKWLAGSTDGAEGKPAANLTSDKETGIGGWSPVDLTYFLETGTLPDGDVVGGLMAEVVDHGVSHLPLADRRAMAAYLRSVPPVSNRIRRQK